MCDVHGRGTGNNPMLLKHHMEDVGLFQVQPGSQ